MTNHLKKQKPQLAKQLGVLKQQVDRPLAAILTLNTIAHTAGAAGVGAQANALFGDQALAIASAVMTLLVLVLSEIIPKTLGARYWRELTPWVVKPLVWLVKALSPFVWLSDKLTAILGKKEQESHFIRAEIEAMADLGKQAGALQQEETEIIRSLLRFRNAKLTQLMTPRPVLFKVHKDLSIADYLKEHGGMSFSRILVFDKDPDDIIGFVHKNDILLAFHRLGEDTKVHKLIRQIYTVPESLHVPTLFQTLVETRNHISLVVDEYGDVQGIVTLEDLIETLTGMDIMDERDTDANMQSVAIEKWQQRFAENDLLVDTSETESAETKPKSN